MRIIAGQFRGRKLLPPEGTGTTRPITDRVKQSLFDILTPLFDDAVVYDCFSGTGSMGLECLSRGAGQVTFFDADRSALQRLRKNIETLGVQKQAAVIPGDLFRWIESNEAKQRARLLFLDPPYRFLKEQPGRLVDLASRLVQAHLTADAVVVFRHEAADHLELPALTAFDVRTYGGMTLEFLKPAPGFLKPAPGD